MNPNPLVSIIVPSYNQGRYLRETLDSIFAQDYRPLEVLVMDGASKDDTVAVLTEYAARHPELRWWSEPDGGVADAVNKGLARATGPIAGIQSSDDVYRPGAIRAAVAEFERAPDVGVVYSGMDIVDEHGAFRLHAPCDLPFTMTRFLARTTVIHQSSTFFRLELARSLGGWRREYFCCDTELWLRMSTRTRIRRVDGVWSNWRTHPGQRDKEAAKMRDSWARMLADSAELRDAPLHWRLAARAGQQLLALHYRATDSRLRLAATAWLAVLIWPPAFRGVEPRRLLLPGLGTLQQWWRRLTGRA
jgi:glycosyltransferase involved in cell wall biosynthesis